MTRVVALAFVAFTAWVLAGVGIGRATAPKHETVNLEQSTIAASALVYHLLTDEQKPLDGYPSPHGCVRAGDGGWLCDFGVLYLDETTAQWEVPLGPDNIPARPYELSS